MPNYFENSRKDCKKYNIITMSRFSYTEARDKNTSRYFDAAIGKLNRTAKFQEAKVMFFR